MYVIPREIVLLLLLLFFLFLLVVYQIDINFPLTRGLVYRKLYETKIIVLKNFVYFVFYLYFLDILCFILYFLIHVRFLPYENRFALFRAKKIVFMYLHKFFNKTKKAEIFVTIKCIII